MTASTPQPASSGPIRVWWLNFLGIALFWGLYVAVQTSLPAVNEPHYLCKAKHFWQPEYCPGDFFLDSSNTHFVFYVAFGWMATFLSLETTAVIGRVIGLGLLAGGWTSLVLRLSSVRWAPIGSAVLFLGITSWQNFSGEWIVGGIESKVIAYGCLFAAWTLMCDRYWKAAGLLLGLGISFHPVVGVWGLAATLLSLVILWLNPTTRVSLPSKREALICCACVVLLALPGLIPALASLQSSVPNPAEADQLQVFERLGHHLNPVQFPIRAYQVYGVLLLVWVVSISVMTFKRQTEPPSASGDPLPRRLWTGVVLGSLLIAGAGLAIGWLNWKYESDLLVKLMKFYPFRLADVLLPMAAAVSVINLLHARRWTAYWLTPAVVICSLYAGYVALTLEMPSRNPEKLSAEKRAAWIDICAWVDENLPEETTVMAPTSSITFRWYASRAAYVTFKDCPQDAAGILEWDRRIKLYKAWASRSYEDDKRFSKQELAELAQLTGASYLIASYMGPMDIEPLHRNKYYRVYRLPQTGLVDD